MSTDLSTVQGPIGPYRDVFTRNTASDYVNPRGFTVQAVGAGNLRYRTIDGVADATETLAAGETFTGPGGVPVLCSIVRGASTVNQIIIGIP